MACLEVAKGGEGIMSSEKHGHRLLEHSKKQIFEQRKQADLCNPA